MRNAVPCPPLPTDIIALFAAYMRHVADHDPCGAQPHSVVLGRVVVPIKTGAGAAAAVQVPPVAVLLVPVALGWCDQ